MYYSSVANPNGGFVVLGEHLYNRGTADFWLFYLRSGIVMQGDDTTTCIWQAVKPHHETETLGHSCLQSTYVYGCELRRSVLHKLSPH